MLKLNTNSNLQITNINENLISLLKYNILKMKFFHITKKILLLLLLITISVILNHYKVPSIINTIMWFGIGWQLGRLLEKIVLRNYIKIDNIKHFKTCLLTTDYQYLIEKYYMNDQKASIIDVQKILNKYEKEVL